MLCWPSGSAGELSRPPRTTRANVGATMKEMRAFLVTLGIFLAILLGLILSGAAGAPFGVDLALFFVFVLSAMR